MTTAHFSPAKLCHGPVVLNTLSGLFQPDVLLPGQYADASHRFTPEIRLLHAVLCDALLCIQNSRVHGSLTCACKRPDDLLHQHARAQYREAMDWVLDHRTDWCTRFECVCDSLHLDAGAVRSAIAARTFRASRRWRRVGLSR